MLPLRFARTWFALAWVAIALALVVNLVPLSGAASMLGLINDKVEHALGYATLTVLLCGIYPRSRYIWIVAGLFAMGVMVEFLQGWMHVGRQREFFDVVANTFGIAIGLTLALSALGGWAVRVENIFGKRER